jgi:4-hydroxy-tetrahydrodipicolinate reductase
MNIALIGYGKMGKAIEEIALQKKHRIVLKIDDQNINELTKENLQKADVAIEFTSPQSAVHNILLCFDAGVPVVCGTTGWVAEMSAVQQKCKELKGSFLYASNFSIGVNIFFELNKKLATLMSKQLQYDVSIEEIHHTEKKDAPSGTAITIAEAIIESSSQKNKWVNRPSVEAEELAITSKRIDPAAGTHTIKYTSGVDDIEIIHTAHNRKGFAAGALLAAEFIYNKKGIFSMKDVLNF